jgi:hypothetical protein
VTSIRRRIALLGGLWIIGLVCLPALRKRLIADDTIGPSVCERQSRVLKNTLSSAGHDKRLATEELERLGLIYDRARPQQPEQAAACRKAFHDAARRLALGWHGEAQRTQDDATFRLADRAYELFLAHFADDQDAYEVNFFWGERLWVLGRWKDAAEQYTRVVEAQPDGQFARESAHAAILAWKNAQISDDDRSDHRPCNHDWSSRDEDCRPPAAEPIPEVQQKLIGAIQTYAKMVPDTPEMPAMLYREASIYYDHCQFDRAEPLFLAVVQEHAKHELAVASANMYLDALVRECKHTEVVAAARKFLDTPELMRDAPFANEMISTFTDIFDRWASAGPRRPPSLATDRLPQARE